jgi:xylulokinase
VQRSSPEEKFEDFLEARWNEEGFVKKICDGYRKGTFEQYGETLKMFDEAEKWVVRENGDGQEAKESKDAVGLQGLDAER